MIDHYLDHSSGWINAGNYEPALFLRIALKSRLFQEKSCSREMFGKITIDKAHPIRIIFQMVYPLR